MSANKQRSRKDNTSANPRFTLLKRKAEADGIPYSSARDAHFRNELPVLKIGRNERYQRWYVTQADWDHWLDGRKVSAS